jgi:hypothetical protein
MPNDVDLLSLISILLTELRRPFKPEWVRGHQDSLQSYESLPFKARLNIDADFLATRYRKRGRLRSSPLLYHQGYYILYHPGYYGNMVNQYGNSTTRD